MKTMKFEHVKRLPEFEKDLKRLKKRYRTIEDDLKNFEDRALIAFHKLDAAIHGIKRIPGLDTPLRGLTQILQNYVNQIQPYMLLQVYR